MNSNDAEIAAGEWLARLDRDEPSREDLAAFDRWKIADPRHAAAYSRLAATWQALDRVQVIRPRSDEPIDNDYLIRAGSLAPDVQDPPRPSAPRPWVFVSIAASVLVVCAVLWIAHLSGGPQIYRTGIGGFQRIVLSDHSAIELNTDSEVRISMTAQLRRVELVRGEASFEVAHDAASRPFIVSAGSTGVRAVGTKFNVLRLGGSVEVIVDEGKVLVGAPDALETQLAIVPAAMLRLSAGQTVLSSGGGVKLEVLDKEAIARKLAWQNQMLVFDDESLVNVVAQFNRYNERQLVIADPKLAALRIGGYFHPTNLDAFVGVLQSAFGIRMSKDGNRLVLAAASN
jgi:transmembrane sensor